MKLACPKPFIFNNPTPICVITCGDRITELLKGELKAHQVTQKSAGSIAGLFQVSHIAEKFLHVTGVFGAPSMQVVSETLFASGVTEIIIIGYAGAIDKISDCRIGDVILPSASYFDGKDFDETFTESYVEISPSPLHAEIVENIHSRSLPIGTTLSPYFHSESFLQAIDDKKIQAIEMEFGIACRVAKKYNANASATFIISDTLSDETWSSSFHSKLLKENTQSLIKALLPILLSRS